MGKINGPTIAAGIAVLGLGCGMVLTNPPPAAYEAYATETLTAYLTTNLCEDLPLGLGEMLGNQCEAALQANQAVVPQIISNSTQRYNLGIMSLYRTTLALPVFLNVPAYQIDTIGAFGQFLTIRASRIDHP